MPETLDRRDANMHEPRLEEEAENPKSNTMLTGLRLAMKRFGDFTYVLATKERKVGFLFLSLLLSNFGRGSQMLLQQYVKARFKWSWGEVSRLHTRARLLIRIPR
jgi:hypothetical protein